MYLFFGPHLSVLPPTRFKPHWISVPRWIFSTLFGVVRFFHVPATMDFSSMGACVTPSLTLLCRLFFAFQSFATLSRYLCFVLYFFRFRLL